MVIDGKKFEEMCASAANSIDSQKEEINDLNVFPVPDGDTGINMSLTMKPVREVRVEPGTLSGSKPRGRPDASLGARQLGCHFVAVLPRHGKVVQG